MGAVTDPVADMLTRIRNGIRARQTRVEMPSSRLKVEIARILKDEGYIANFKVAEEEKKKVLRIGLRYDAEGASAIAVLGRVSKPGRRVYVGKQQIPRVLGGLGVAILTTPRGVMTGKAASRAGLGGEFICQVY
jgi:small subunit ribosomal protein S8